ncbi:innexin inx2-like [Limulus polyphemus]|uniref:Innexin n=1 Tax=Limulus polyphemus TaxID=6850 RepID=A0ABM1B9S5_LIMPO|nr:innexin inx2-like [Limulus polyphemus]
MDSVFNFVKSFIKAKKVVIDNIGSRIHHKASVVLLLACSIIVTAKQYVGDPIDCIGISKKDIPTDLLDTYCWIHSTFSVEKGWNKTVGKEVPYPGVDKYTEGEKRIHHTYYQWVCFMLLLQAGMFYVPHWFWKAMENSRVKNLMLGLNSPILPEGERNENKKLLVKYFKENKDNHVLYFTSFVISEVLNFINVLVQIFLMDEFLQGEFLSYGHQVVQFKDWDWSANYNPMLKVFPRMTKCTFHTYGSSGDVQRHDTLCVLPVNIINEKIYAILWFWFLIVTLLTGLALVYRFFTIVFPLMRYRSLFLRNRQVNQDRLWSVVQNFGRGDWFLLCLLGENIDETNFNELISDLAEDFSKTENRKLV